MHTYIHTYTVAVSLGFVYACRTELIVFKIQHQIKNPNKQQTSEKQYLKTHKVCWQTDGWRRGNKEIAQEMTASLSTGHSGGSHLSTQRAFCCQVTEINAKLLNLWLGIFSFLCGQNNISVCCHSKDNALKASAINEEIDMKIRIRTTLFWNTEMQISKETHFFRQEKIPKKCRSCSWKTEIWLHWASSKVMEYCL